jgi:hypothetical protein
MSRFNHVPASTEKEDAMGWFRRLRSFSIMFPLLTLLLLIAAPVWAGQPFLPPDVPNILDPQVLTRFTPVGVANLRGDPDFPVLILENRLGEYPQVIFLGLDARNGKDSWSLGTDPIILIVLFADSATILGAYVDAGFADHGKASGRYESLDQTNYLTLDNLFREVAAIHARTYM